ncbi:MAG: DedA family protein [Methylobacteriaceae bacterium]|nr:DedA family protein [Methylobacteriaceae bacterium]
MLSDRFIQLAEFVRQHGAWAPPIAGLLAFLKSFPVVSVFIPATAPLLALGALIGAGSLDFVPIWIAVSLGAALGDVLSYWLGYHYRDGIRHVWPLSRYPETLPRGEAFFRRWGVLGIVLARFFGPLRASAPIVAGVFEMPFVPFQVANILGALLWAGILLAPGAFGFGIARDWIR